MSGERPVGSAVTEMPPLTVAAVSQVPLLAAVAVTLETVSVPCPASVTATFVVCASVPWAMSNESVLLLAWAMGCAVTFNVTAICLLSGANDDPDTVIVPL